MSGPRVRCGSGGAPRACPGPRSDPPPGKHPGLGWLREHSTHRSFKERGPLPTPLALLSLDSANPQLPADRTFGAAGSGPWCPRAVRRACLPVPEPPELSPLGAHLPTCGLSPLSLPATSQRAEHSPVVLCFAFVWAKHIKSKFINNPMTGKLPVDRISKVGILMTRAKYKHSVLGF